MPLLLKINAPSIKTERERATAAHMLLTCDERKQIAAAIAAKNTLDVAAIKQGLTDSGVFADNEPRFELVFRLMCQTWLTVLRDQGYDADNVIDTMLADANIALEA